MPVQDLAGTVLFIAAAWGVFLILVAAARLALGQDPRAPLLWGVSLLLFATGGYGIVYWLYGGGSALGVNAAFVVTPADYYAEQGIPFQATRYFPLEVTVVPILPVHDYYMVSVDWGDGSWSSWPQEWPEARPPGEPASLSHVYHDTGLYTVRISIDVWRWTGYDWDVSTITRTFLVNVTAPWDEYAMVVKSFVSSIDEEGGLVERGVKKALKAGGIALADAFAGMIDLMARLMAKTGLNAGQAFYYYIAMPVPSNNPAIGRVYGEMSMWALVLLPIVVIARLAWEGFWEWERGGQALLEVLRDSIAVLVGIYVFIDLYGILAETLNTVSLSVAQLGQLGALYAMAISVAALAGAVGLIAPSAAGISAIITVMLLTIVLLGALKWLIASAIVASAPMLLLLWLAPGFRTVTQAALHLLAGLFIFSIVAAALSALVSQMALTLTAVNEGRSLIVALTLPLVFALATPWITNMITSHMGLGGLAGGIRGLARAPPTPSISTVAAAAGGGLILAGKRPMSGQVLGHAPSPVYQPRHQPATPPAPPPQPTSKPQIQEVPPPRGLEKLTRPVRDVLAEARGEAETVEPSPRRKAAVAAAKAGLAAAGWARQQLRDFDHVLSRETGITLGRAAQKTYRAGKWTAQQTIRAAKWAAPRIKEGAARIARYAKERINARQGRLREKPQFLE